ncbi:MAG: hypothetical protein ACI4EG_01080 [Fusicatenibacter sp.]
MRNTIKRTLGLTVLSVLIVSLLAITVFAGSPGKTFYFDFGFFNETQCNGPANKTDAGSSSGNQADVYVTQDTTILYSIRQNSTSTTNLTNTVELASSSIQQHAVLTYKQAPSNTSYYLFAESPFGRYGEATGTWYP